MNTTPVDESRAHFMKDFHSPSCTRRPQPTPRYTALTTPTNRRTYTTIPETPHRTRILHPRNDPRTIEPSTPTHPSSRARPLDLNLPPDVCLSAATRIALQQTIRNSWAETTQNNYNTAINNFIQFCDNEDIPQHMRLPADEIVLCAYVARGAGKLSHSTIRNHLSALRAWHHTQNVRWKGGDLLKVTLNGAKRTTPPTSIRPRRPPVTLQMMEILMEYLNPTSHFDAAVGATASIAFWGQCRLGELLPDHPHQLEHATPRSSQPRRKHLKIPHTFPINHGTSSLDTTPTLSLFIPRTKTQTHGEHISIVPQPYSRSNPFTVLDVHLRRNLLAPNDPLLATKIEERAMPLSRSQFLQRCNDIWSQNGLPSLTGHSFRIGGTTELLLAGTPPDVVKATGRWSSDSFLRYWRHLDDLAARHIQPSTPRHRHHPGSRSTHTSRA